MKFSISMDDDLVKRVDAYADDNYMSRSGLITQACNTYLTQAEMYSLLKSMSLAMNKIADTGSVDHETMEQLEDFDRMAKMIIGAK